MVAIEPKTGRVLVNASNPPYDPNRVPEHLAAAEQGPERAPVRPRHPGPVPAGLDLQGRHRRRRARQRHDHAGLDDQLPRDPRIVEGHALHNDFDEDFGAIGLDTALTNSVNTFFAQLGQQVGEDTLFKYMNAFGFNSKPQIDLPSDQLSISGIFDGGTLLNSNDPIDIGRVAIGQERLLATPLQMAEVAATVANGGVLMKPQIWNKVVDPDGRLTKRMDPSEQSHGDQRARPRTS